MKLFIQPDREEIKRHLLNKITEKKLQGTPWFIGKVLQIYEMLLVRHGLMIVGDSMSGKTTAYQILAEVLREIKNDPKTKSEEFGVNYRYDCEEFLFK